MINLYTVFNIPRRPWIFRSPGLWSMIATWVVIFWAVVFLSACATSVPVTLVHPDGRMVQCGPYRIGGYGNQAIAAATSEVQCITDWKEQGFLRR